MMVFVSAPALRTAKVLSIAMASLMALLAVRALEAQWPPVAMWLFVVLTLTLGFGHGALDAVLLLEQYKPRSKALAVSALYLLSVLLAGWALSKALPWALLLLVLMSAWHFGELHGYALWARLCVGGASVMWPMLVAQTAMSRLLQGALGAGFNTAWQAWHLLAYGWLALLLAFAVGKLVGWFLSRQRDLRSSNNFLVHRNNRLFGVAVEIAVVLCLYLALSPLLAFTLYFGGYHCIAHVARVRRALHAHHSLMSQRYAVALVASVLTTATLLALLWWFLAATQWLDGISPDQARSAQVLQWLVISLAAVTLPHLALVSSSARWLGR